MIEDPRDIERKRTLGIEDPDEITRDDLADALAEVHRLFPALCYLSPAESPLKVNIFVLSFCEYCGLLTGIIIQLYHWQIFYVF